MLAFLHRLFQFFLVVGKQSMTTGEEPSQSGQEERVTLGLWHPNPKFVDVGGKPRSSIEIYF
jgi:hypothetical protein